MACVVPMYRPRDAEHTVHQVISAHLGTFLNAVAEAGDEAGLPQFVEREFREFLLCGMFEAGGVLFQCEGCRREHLVPFSVVAPDDDQPMLGATGTGHRQVLYRSSRTAPSTCASLGPDFRPEPYLAPAHERARAHKWYMSARLVTINDGHLDGRVVHLVLP